GGGQGAARARSGPVRSVRTRAPAPRPAEKDDEPLTAGAAAGLLRAGGWRVLVVRSAAELAGAWAQTGQTGAGPRDRGAAEEPGGPAANTGARTGASTETADGERAADAAGGGA
ncbi:hypothetical protein, partial [Actinomadura napierensis]|uniref:hypothetical protein n=1 Tax=Actinomadura napierensis TaxID=267854 RepID=UPI00387E4E4D